MLLRSIAFRQCRNSLRPLIGVSFSGVKLWSQKKISNQQEETIDEAPSIGDMGELLDVTIDKDRYLFGEGKMFQDLGLHG